MSRKLLHEAMLAWRDGDRDRAKALFEQGVAQRPGDLDANGYPLYGQQYLSHLIVGGEHEAARELIGRLSPEGRAPSWVERTALRWPGFLSADERRAAWLRLAEADPTNPGARVHLFNVAVAEGDVETAREHGAALAPLRNEPTTSPDRLIAIGEGLHLTGEPTAARPWLERALAGDPWRARVRFSLAALQADLGDLAASRGNFEAGALLSRGREPRLDLILDYAGRRWPLRARGVPTRPSLETVIFTHVTSKLVRHHQLSAPGTGLIEATWESLSQLLQPDIGVVTVFFDRRPTALDAAYEAALAAFCESIGATLVVGDANGLRRQWLAASRRAEADLVLFVEHDWSFRNNCPPLAKVRRLFAVAADVNQVRFNKHRNVKTQHHPAPRAGERPDLARVCRLPEFLNQPHVIRRDVLRELIVPLIEHDSRRDQANDGAGGVEETINEALTLAEHHLGLPFLLRLTGFCVWGELGAPKRLIHLGC